MPSHYYLTGERGDADLGEPSEEELGFYAPCYCGEHRAWFSREPYEETCDGLGLLNCFCGGDMCVCHHHGETECLGCVECAEEGDMPDEDY